MTLTAEKLPPTFRSHIMRYEPRIGMLCLRMDGCRMRFSTSRDYFDKVLARYYRKLKSRRAK